MTRSRTADPETRDRTIDALRAVAIVGVVVGHWLVSAVVSDPARPAAWHGASPLAEFPALIPATWVLQTLGPFFFAGGFAVARRGSGTRRPTARFTRFARLAGPVGLLAAVWLPAWLLLRVTGAPDSTLHVVRSLLVHPLWFLIVYLVLTVSAPLLRAAVGRFRLWPLAPAIALVAACDVARHLEVAAWLHPAATVAGWAVPYLLGIALAEGLLSRRAGRILAVTGIAAGAGLVLLAGYPASAVGVPGDGWSNLDPPSLFALALAAAQIGVFLLVRDRLAGWLRRPALGTPVAVLNRSAMTVYCWHQSALLLVTFGGLLAGPLPGLSDPPAGMWPLHRLLWLPVFAVTLVLLCAAFHRAERVRTSRRPPR
ncbi:acyltransferase family protein [Actinoplanes flavus]|uniref:Acyltransferase n=1 Tax=Actinoplanes flavus TaxID=2820290 RepID=A0ABS3UTM6_9ACTN|nr:acyltransferase [Actinoplanes flavus]MBO3741907.1 acyltransferase [Actinoplanes flavus]